MDIKIILVVIFSSLTVANYAQSPSSPYIIDYYPDCDYQVIEQTSIKIKTKTPAEQATIDKVLDRIIRQGTSAQAEAIILTKRHYKAITGENKNLDGSRYKTYRFGYDADLIKLCEGSSKLSAKRTPFNHEGRASNVELKYKTIKLPPLVIDMEAEQPKRLKHSIIDPAISGNGTFYGVPLGASFEEARQVLGDPVIELFLESNNRLAGYGRHHWLYFQDDKLAKVSSRQKILSVQGVNHIPQLEYFDRKNWLIEGKHGYKSELSHHVRKSIVKNQQSTLKLTSTKPDREKIRYITGFSLSLNNQSQQLNPNSHHLLAKKLTENDINAIKHATSDITKSPLGMIYEGKRTVHMIIDSYSLVTYKHSKPFSMELSENLLVSGKNKPDWEILGFRYGETYQSAAKKFKANANDTGYEVYLPYDEFQLKLEFDDEGSDRILYKATAKF